MKRVTWILGATLLLGVIGPASAAVITFDEFPADNTNGGLPAGRYASLGVTFVTTDDGTTWGGLSNGDPGNWDLEGTNGPIFSGFNGGSYALSMLFNTDVSNFALDVSRSLGSSPGNTFTLEGYNNGVLVESHTVTLGPINQWQTVSLSNIVDETRWSGAGSGFHPFGVDNVQWSAAQAIPEPSSLALFGLATVSAAGYFGWRRKRPVTA